MKNFTLDDRSLAIFSLNYGTFFQFSKKHCGDLPLPSPL